MRRLHLKRLTNQDAGLWKMANTAGQGNIKSDVMLCIYCTMHNRLVNNLVLWLCFGLPSLPTFFTWFTVTRIAF